ncbi:trace amine-associated receptor 1-like [Alosa sapidissima]|uniref:trace amine-associated receptor 1-like n=1 Tax=Alosa sapidissima TaxID=34773 RepID=UPI001C097486|nr:trace amine-associated receptor 1-like [Alosa sapidissima]
MAGKNQTYPDNRGAVPLCYESVNGSCPKFIYPVVIRVPLYIFFGTTVLLTVIGNLLVVITVVHFKQLRSPTNYLIVSLAMADLLVGAFLMPPSIVRSVENCWYLGNFYCKVHSSIDVMLCNASILNLSFIAVDRYYAICHPLRYQTTITPSVTMAMIFISWSVPGLVGFGMIFLELNILGYEEFYYNNFYCEGACILFQGGLSGALSSVLSFYIPGVIMLSIYAKLYSIAQKQARSIQDKHNTNGTSASKMERKATITLAIIMGVFLSLWLPFFICNIIDPFIGYSIPPLVFDMVMWIAYFNSTCNPIVYALFYSWFRKAFKIILFGKIFGQNSSSVNLFRE